MADDAVFAGPKGKGPPTWLIVGGVGVGAIALVMLLSKGSNSGGTTAAGTSINAALGSLQEESQNMLGTIQAGQLQNNANFSSLGGQLADTQASILSAIADQGTQTGQQIQGAIDNINQNTNTQNQSVMSAIADALQKVLTGQGQITSTVQSESQAIQQQVGGVGSNVAATQQQIIDGLGSVQNMESQILQTIQPQLDQLFHLNQTLLTQTGQDAANTQAQINTIGKQIVDTINQQAGYNQQNFETINAGLQSIQSDIIYSFYQMPNRYKAIWGT